MRHIRHSAFCILHSALCIVHCAFCIALALAAASASATPGWTTVQLTAANPYRKYQNALRDQLPYLFTNSAAKVANNTAAALTDGTILIAKKGNQVGNNSSIFYKLGDDPAGIDLKSVRITTSWTDSGRSQIKISKLFIKTVSGGDAWIELPNSSVTGPSGKNNYQATYADSDGALLAEGATDLWIYFNPAQQNSGAAYTEIEAEIGFEGDIYLPLTLNSSPFGTVTVSPSSPHGDNTFLLNTDVTLTATPAAGFYFYAWQGDVPAANAKDSTITMPMDDVRTITPIFTPGILDAPGWVCTNITSRNEYPEYANALRGRLPYIFTNGNASVAVSGASTFTDGVISLNSSTTKQIGNKSSLFYKLSDDPAGVSLKNVRITSSWKDTGRAQIKISKLFVKTVSGGDDWIELPNSSLTGPSSANNYQATYSDTEGTILAEGATDLWIYFNPAQQNDGAAYMEIEAEIEENGDVYIPLNLSFPSYGTVAISPPSPNGDNTFPLDSDVTLTVTPGPGYTFHSWVGDVPAGHAYDTSITIIMDDVKTVTPIFSSPWYYASNVMTDGYWRVTTSLSGGKRTITKVESIFPSSVLDFRKETIGTDAPIVALNNTVLNNKGWPVRDLLFPDSLTTIGDSCRQMYSLTNLVLSANLVSLGHCAFYSCSALRYVTPLLPETLATMSGDQTFQSAPLSGRLVVSNPNLTQIGSGAFQGSSGLKEADFSASGLSRIEDSFVFGQSGITNLWLPPTLTYFGKSTIYQCNALRSVYFQSLPSFHYQSFEGAPTTMRIVIFKDDTDWLYYLENSAASFTPWADLSASVKNTYTFTDNCKPYGRVKIGSAGTVVFVATRRRPDAPTVLFLR